MKTEHKFIKVSDDKKLETIHTAYLDNYHPVLGEIFYLNRLFYKQLYRIIGIKTDFNYITDSIVRRIFLQELKSKNIEDNSSYKTSEFELYLSDIIQDRFIKDDPEEIKVEQPKKKKI